tara:strand:- start:1473 stop:2747 length:1275 start_codon:yes stop_codon:yes gene_type:complete
MTNGSIAAHAGLDPSRSGTQGSTVTNTVNDEGDIVSVFWTRHDATKHLLSGSCINEISATGTGGDLQAGGHQYFTLNNDVDALGDCFLQITTKNNTAPLRGFGLLRCIRKIEVIVGTQVYQTLLTNDILALNTTELSEDAYENFALSMSGCYSADGKRNAVFATKGDIVGVGATDFTGVCRIPIFTRSCNPKLPKYADVSEEAYLQCAAPHQQFKIKIYMVNDVPASSGLSSGTKFSLKLYGQTMVVCNEERQQMKATPLPKRIKMTQNVTKTSPTSSGPIDLDLDYFSLYTSHIIFMVSTTSTEADGSPANISIDTVELKLNSSSYSGSLDGAMLTGPVTESLGLFSNGFYMGGGNVTDNVYVFPLASRAYSGSSVPLNRYDNIRVEIHVTNSVPDGPCTISATGVGSSTLLYRNNAAQIAMY